MKKISIITINYNNAFLLEKTIKSVLEQEYKNIEYIIIDGGSTDSSRDIIKNYENKLKYWISEKDQGISDAFNKGIEKCSEDSYILMLNAGDTFINQNSLSLIVNYLNGSLVCFQSVTLSGKKIGSLHRKIKSYNYKALIPHQSTFVHKSLYNKYGGYSLEYKYRMDYDFFARVTKEVEPIMIDVPLVLFDNSGLTSQFKSRVMFEKEGSEINIKHYNKKSIFIVPYFRALLYWLIVVFKFK